LKKKKLLDWAQFVLYDLAELVKSRLKTGGGTTPAGRMRLTAIRSSRGLAGMQAIQGSATVEQRKSPRRNCTTTVMFENYLTGNYFEGRMVNYSREGMCFESDIAPEIGTEIFIGVEKSPYSPNYDVFRAKVMWSRTLTLKESYYSIGVGVRYC
jgi:hypothetical protein